MEKYKLGKPLGDGSFGSVIKAINQQTGKIVAIKHIKKKYEKWEECLNLNEIKVLMKLHHPNIINLYEMIKKNNELYFVFQYMDKNIYQLMQERTHLNHFDIRNIIYQTLQALAYMHRHGFFHRDLKPENLLEINGTVKIADFGLVREIRAKPPFTEYVSTRWYRSPEVLLRSRNYNSPMDMFAIGAIMAELYRMSPLFPGSTERDQLNKIFQVLGTPSKEQWPEGYKLASSISLQLPSFAGTNLSTIIPKANSAAIHLIECLLQVNPQKRMTANQALQHQYFQIKQPHEKIERGMDYQEEEEDKKEDLNWVKNARYVVGKSFKL